MIPWCAVALADVAVPGPPERGRFARDLPPPEGPPGEVPSWAAPTAAFALAGVVLVAFVLARAARRRPG